MRQATDSLPGGHAPGHIRAGTVVAGRFRVEALLAREGGTDVYQATDLGAGAPRALRIVPAAAVIHGVDRLLGELAKTQPLRHKNLADVEAVGMEGDFVFVAAELVDGQTLREFIDAKRAEGRGVSLKGACNLVAHVANALEYASRVTAHGALSPAVVWVNRAGRVKVSGLALAAGLPSFARHGTPAGAPETLYMAPELIAGGPPRPAADVFSLGMIFYELLVGHPPGSPFRAASTLAPDVPAGVDVVIGRALARSPEDRWPNATAFKEALQRAAGLPSARSTGGHATLDARTSGAPAPGAAGAGAAGGRRPASAQPTVAAPPHQPHPGPGASADAGGRAGQPPPPSGASTAAAGAAAAPVPSGGGAPRGRASGGAGRGTGRAASAQAPQPLAPAPDLPPELRATIEAMLTAGRDEAAERWLIQKDKLDFGPFSMVQIRAQIERGDIRADHVILDSESGNRCRVREYPGLGDLAKVAHRRLEQVRRAQADQRHEKTEKKKSMFTMVVVSLVVVTVLGSVGIFLLSRHDVSGGHLASREEEAEIDNYLKSVKIGGMKATVRRAGAHRPGGGGSQTGGAAEDLSNDANFGDSSKGFNEGDQTLDDDQIQNTMMANYRKLIPCIAHAGVSNIALDFAVRGNGKVSAVKVNGQRVGALPACMLARMQSFNFPKFNGSKTIASWSMSMGH